MITSLKELIDAPELQSNDAESCYITDGISWHQYEVLLAKLGDRAGYRVTYLEGVLEILSPSRRHEGIKKRIGNLLEVYFEETNTEYFPLGSTTFRRQEKRGGKEPDESYCIGSEKEIPDLAIEVVLTSGGVDDLAVYQKLGVTEVWFWEIDRFSIYHLREKEDNLFYVAIAQSELLSNLDLEMLATYVKHPNPLSAIKEFRQRIQA